MKKIQYLVDNEHQELAPLGTSGFKPQVEFEANDCVH